MEHTEKLGLVLPDENETYNINVFNENFRTIDKNIGGAENLQDLLTENKTSLVAAINEVFQQGGEDIDIKLAVVDAILTADGKIEITEENTWEEICAAIVQIATNWVAKDNKTRVAIIEAIDAVSTGSHFLALTATWAQIQPFIRSYMTTIDTP